MPYYHKKPIPVEARQYTGFCLRADELIDRVIFSGERAEFGLGDEI